ncbi:MAG: hypothetical protein RR101_14755 [Burkholderiaceae bacterium]
MSKKEIADEVERTLLAHQRLFAITKQVSDSVSHGHTTVKADDFNELIAAAQALMDEEHHLVELLKSEIIKRRAKPADKKPAKKTAKPAIKKAVKKAVPAVKKPAVKKAVKKAAAPAAKKAAAPAKKAAPKKAVKAPTQAVAKKTVKAAAKPVAKKAAARRR